MVPILYRQRGHSRLGRTHTPVVRLVSGFERSTRSLLASQVVQDAANDGTVPLTASNLRVLGKPYRGKTTIAELWSKGSEIVE